MQLLEASKMLWKRWWSVVKKLSLTIRLSQRWWRLFGACFLLIFLWVIGVEKGVVHADANLEGKGVGDKSPFGACAHITRSSEHTVENESLRLMRDAGINWVRTDFEWSSIERTHGVISFEGIDETVRSAEEVGVRILPILDYDVGWATPAWQHLDAWRDYVRIVVSRYKDRLRYWEVWNEPNSSNYWYGRPDAIEYGVLLKATYETIKEIDSGLKVVLGGLYGTPTDFIRILYAEGYNKYFDVMNIHPYMGAERPESGNLYNNIIGIRQLMAEYGDRDKPIWITEIGWSTYNNPVDIGALLKNIVTAGLNAIDPNRKEWSPAMLDDLEYPDRIRDEAAESVRIMLDPMKVQTLGLKDLSTLSSKTYGMLVMPPSEGFPIDFFSDILAYVRGGGVVMFWDGIPLYFAKLRDKQGSWQTTVASSVFRQNLHIGIEAWWTMPEVPKEAGRTVPAEGWPEGRNFPLHAPKATRFLNNDCLKQGDRFLPIIYGEEGNYIGAAAGVYAFHSDLSGGVIGISFRGLTAGLTNDRQAQILPRSFLIALQSGVERVFWYEFLGDEFDPYIGADHFGLVHHDLNNKPAYGAMAALARARPEGSVSVEGSWSNAEDGLYYSGSI